MNVFGTYDAGAEVLGDGMDVSSFVPWLSAFTGGGSAKKGPSTEEAVKKAVEEERKREAESRRRTLLYGAGGLLGIGVVGAGAYFIAKKRK